MGVLVCYKALKAFVGLYQALKCGYLVVGFWGFGGCDCVSVCIKSFDLSLFA